VFAMTADAGTPQKAARRIGAAVAALGIERFDLMGEGAGAAAAVWLALARQDIGSVALAAPDGLPDEAFREMQLPGAPPIPVVSPNHDRTARFDPKRQLAASSIPRRHFPSPVRLRSAARP
jgi:pimeloyl-ACP methyl ester carboxylesterase